MTDAPSALHLLGSENIEVTMEPLKKEAIDVISSLPEDADMEEIMYRLYVLENIRQGQKDVERGNTTPADQVLQDIQSW